MRSLRPLLGPGFGVLFVVVAMGVLPAVIGDYEVDLLSKVFVLAIFALSLELLVGQVRLVSLGHAAFIALGAYGTAFMLQSAGPGSFLTAMVVAMAMSGAYALPVAALSLRTRGVYFIMVTLAFAQLVYYVVHDTKIAGGSDGIYLNGTPTVSFFGWTPFDVTRPVPFYYTSLVLLIAVFAFLTLLARSRFGRALAGIRANEQRMRAAGFATYPYKIGAFVIGAMLAGLAGFLRASRDGYVSPDLSSWHQSGTVLLVIILGGIGRLHGAVIGALAFVLLQEVYRSETIFGEFARRWQLMLGVTLIASVLALPEGLAGLPQRLRWRGRAHG